MLTSAAFPVNFVPRVEDDIHAALAKDIQTLWQHLQEQVHDIVINMFSRSEQTRDLVKNSKHKQKACRNLFTS